MILISDDDKAICSSLSFLLKRAGFDVACTQTPDETIVFVRENNPELILMDMNYSATTTGEEGIHLLRRIKVLKPEIQVILMTGWGSIQLAVEGMKAGAFDFITKPWNNLMLLKTIQTALDIRTADAGQQKEPVIQSKPAARSETGFEKIIGRSDAIRRVLNTVKRIAGTNASVLITGESGTGKELIAEAIHQNSRRQNQPFIKVNLGGISSSLFESEMFGHKKGAFTDAFTDRTGRFELADAGTIFLDEIGELDLSCQVKLLRVLQDQTFEVLGDSKMRRVDVRVVSATNRNMETLVADKAFREDLYYRINLIPIHIPPLRERREDIPLLVNHFADLHCRRENVPAVTFAADAMTFLQQLPYPGNIRELKNLVERTLLVHDKTCIMRKDVEQQYHALHGAVQAKTDLSGITLEMTERRQIEEALERYDNNISRVALALGISRGALYRRMGKYNLTK